ncbi:UDP-glucosyltransferase 2 [Manduca sexta]|uniref:UDP-glucosyltransferase 2 n=1 Tax=Manduca sexta TaxID=7130 RepID=UPI00188DCA21|nr:UDP-glucosyltransferase 2 [Manduca sexta]
MNLSVLQVLLGLVLIKQCTSLNILGIYPYHGKSHFLVFRVFLHELANRGHNVTIISHYPEKDPPANYHDISLAGTMKIIEDNTPVEKSYMTLLDVSVFLGTIGTENCKVMLANKQVQNLIKQKPKFDVILVEQFNTDCGLGIAYKLGAPVVSMSSHTLMPFHYQRLGIPYNPSYTPFHFLGGGSKPTLYQRVERVVFDFYFRTMYSLITQRNDQQILAQYFDDIPPLEELARQSKLLLLYQHFSLTGSTLYPANVIEVAGYHVKDAKPLTGDLKKFVDEAENGVIYISFGSVVKAATMPSDKVKAILDTINELPYRFIWKWEDKMLKYDKNKLYISDWLPQVDILGHKKTVAFLSHGGMGGTTEAVHFGVPIVAMPIGGDQPANAAAIEESGFGLVLEINDLTKENLLASFKKVLNPKFRERVKEISSAWHDRPMRSLDTAIYWTEYAARHPNFTFRTTAADTPYYQFIQLDVYVIFAAILAIIYIIFKALIYLCCGSKTKKAVNKKSKRQ